MKKEILVLAVLIIGIIPIAAQSYNPQIKTLTNAAEAGDIKAQKYLANLYLNGSSSVSQNKALAYKWYVSAAEQNDPESQYLLATNEDLKLIVEAHETQQYWLRQAAINQHPFAIERYGELMVLEKKDPSAFEFFTDMRNGKYGDFATIWGGIYQSYCYLNGVGVEKDFKKGLEGLGNIYKVGKEFQQNDEDLAQSLGDNLVRLTSYPLGNISKDMGCDSLAVKFWMDCFMLDNSKVELVNNIAWACYRMKDYLHAQETFKGATNIPDNKVKAEGYNGLAYVALKIEPVPNFERAYEYVDKAISLAGSNKKAMIRYLDTKGEFYVMQGKNKEAQAIFRRINDLDRDGSLADYNSPFLRAMRGDASIAMDDDVDSSIPKSKKINSNTFVVVIANENYKRAESVPYAIHDGQVFAQYAQLTLGIPAENINITEDATGNDIRYAISWISQIASAFGEDAKLIVYYSGHGFPDAASMDAYLLPTDGYASDVNTGVKLSDLYQQLGNLPAKSVTVFIDACFSGSVRGNTMLASSRGVALKSNPGTPTGKMVVFTASQATETAFPYDKVNHGLFTYVLLSALKSSAGNISLGDLESVLLKEVAQKSIIQNGKTQTPSVNASPSLGESWKNWTLK